MSLRDVKILDCTIRDGGYINEWGFSLDFAKALYRAVSDAGVDYIETGFFFGESRETKSPWANYDPAVYDELCGSVPDGCRISGLLNFGGFELEEIPPASETHFDMLRTVCHQVDAEAATRNAAALTEKGYEVTINYMGISNYSPQQLIDLTRIIHEHKEPIGYFYVADSFGSLMPADTRRIVDTLKYATQASIGFHPHNNLQMAFANSLAAIEAGAGIVDGSVFGMGRGAGNLFTEVMVAYLEAEGESRYQLLPILQFADLFMEPLREQYDWGISLPQMISGILQCHPNYPTNLLKFKMHTADDIYRMLRELPAEQRGRYKKPIMEEARADFLTKKVQKENSISSGLNESVQGCDSVLLLCGGRSVRENEAELKAFVENRNCYTITVNNPVPPLVANAVFFGNQRRLLQHRSVVADGQEVILGPVINEKAEDALPFENVSRIMLANVKQAGFPGIFPSTSGAMAILACAELGFKKIYVAGMDGFSVGGSDFYYDEPDRIEEESIKEELNTSMQSELTAVKELLRSSVKIELVTPSNLNL